MKQRIRFARLVALTIIFTPWLAGAQKTTAALGDGFTYTFRVSSRDNAAGPENVAVLAQAWATSDRLRFDMLPRAVGTAGTLLLPDKGFVIVDRKAGTMTLGDADEHEYDVLPITSSEALGMGLGALMGDVVSQTKIGPVQRKIEVLGAESVNGVRANHFRVTEDYSLEMRINEARDKGQVHAVTDIWVNDEMKNLPNPFVEMLKGAGNAVLSAAPDVRKGLGGELRKYFSGVPIKTVSKTNVTAMTLTGGTPTVSQTTIEMLEIKRVMIPAARFTIPPGYNKAAQ